MAGLGSTLAPMAPAPDPLPPLPTRGRRFEQARTAELADVDRRGRLRLDAVARYLQDVAMADVCDAGLDEPAWIVRRTLVLVERFPRYLERLQVRTHCWSMGRFAAERRTVLTGNGGGRIDTLTLWVRLDPGNGRPAALTPSFRATYAEAVEGRTTDHELRHPPPPSGRAGRTFALRASDLDLRGHVNNAVCWAAVEEVLAARAEPSVPHAFEMEFRAAIPPISHVDIVAGDAEPPRPLALWLVADGKACASAFAWSG